MDFQQSFYNKSNYTSSPNPSIRENPSGPIQFVFIDESSRDSKRLKITRACESCRRRKVKCDAPHVAPGESCTSCRRLNVECVMQQAGQDSEERLSPDEDKIVRRQPGTPKHDYLSREGSFAREPANLSPRSQTGSESSGRGRSTKISTSIRDQNVVASSRPQHRNSTGGDSFPPTYPTSNPGPETAPAVGPNALTDIFGNLSIQLNGRATFLDDPDRARSGKIESNRKRATDQTGFVSTGFPISFETIERYLPAEDLANDLIHLYFENLHPYLPVLNKTLFLTAWTSHRRKELSPYLLLSLFACASRYSSDPRVLGHKDDSGSGGDMWYSLALQYKEDFHDAPRISTLQAEIINLKALETRPKLRGYAYRCWFLLGSILRMGRDLNLDKMITQTSQDADSVSGRRIWQVCLIMDQMMSTSQGRDLQLAMAEVDLTLLSESHEIFHELDYKEVSTQNDFVYLIGLTKILRRSSEVFMAVGIRFPYTAEPQYPALADILVRWRENLPAHLSFQARVDKVLPSHFVAHLHLTYYMIMCLLHRPWIVSTGKYGATGEWREHLRLCNEAAQEALIIREMMLAQYGPAGFKWMIRGNNFATYAAVITTMIHAVCVTCPEAEFNSGARDALDRSIRILDKLAEIGSTPQMKVQLGMLKQIFSSPASDEELQYDVQSMPPELATLQEQYRMMQESDFHPRGRHTHGNARPKDVQNYPDYQLPYQQTAELFTAPLNQYQVPAHEEQYFHAMSSGINNPLPLHTTAENFPNDLDPTSQISPHLSQNAWNPAGLIGAWNLNFPYTSGGYEHVDTTFGIHTPVSDPLSQSVQSQLSMEHQPQHSFTTY